MNEANKSRLVKFLKVLSVVLLAALAIITNAEIWNVASSGGTDGFHVVVSILNFIAEGVGIFFYQKAIRAFSDPVPEKKDEK